MSIIDFKTNLPGSQQDTATPTNKPKPRFWMNIGYLMPSVNSVTGEAEDLFVSLPFGIPLDTMSLAKVEGGEFSRRLARTKNAFLAKLMANAQLMEPGAESIVDVGETFQIRIRRVMEETETTASDTFSVPDFKF